jgi:hypothetical protein
MPIENSLPLLPDTPMQPSKSLVFRVFALFLFGLSVAFGLAVLRAHTGPLFATNAPLVLTGESLALINGLRLTENKLAEGVVSQFGKTLIIARPSEDGSAVVALKLPAQVALNYRYVEAVINGGIAQGGVAFIWRGGALKDKVRQRAIPFAGATALPIAVEPSEGWTGEIIGAALQLNGPFTAPIEIESVTLSAPSLAATAQRLLSAWFSFETWDNSSINFLYGGPIDLAHPLPLYLFFGLLVSFGLFFFLSKDGRMAGDVRIYWILPLLFWLVGDVRWQISLLQQTKITAATFSGKSSEEKHLAAEDGRLFKLMQTFGAKMPIADKGAKTGYRIFVFSDDEYTRARAAYHLYPRNTFALPGVTDLLAAKSYQAGDYIALIDKKGVRFNRQTQTLNWDQAESIGVELLHYENGNGLFRVGGALSSPALPATPLAAVPPAANSSPAQTGK